MYELALIVHSWLRWGALAMGFLATGAAFARDASARADRWGFIFTIVMDLQLLVGLALYIVLSPATVVIRSDFGAAFRDPVARFWAVEHLTLMLIAIVVVHVGRVLARKASTPAKKRVRLLACFAFATIMMLIGTPWPGMSAGRPLFRF